jgi:hypothetical protein
MIIEAVKFAIQAIKLELAATTLSEIDASADALRLAKEVLQEALNNVNSTGWIDLTDEESMSLMLDKKDAPFDLVTAVQDKLRELNT